MESHITVLQCSIDFGIKILEYCKGYACVDVNHIYDMSSNMYNYVRLRGDLLNR